MGLMTLTMKRAAAAVLMAAMTAVPAMAQGDVKIHGHVQNAAGMAIKSGDVKLTTDKTAPAKDRSYKFSFPLDGNGDYKGTGVAPGDYLAIVIVDGKSADFMPVVLKAGDDKTLDFDMTREEYIKGMSEADKAALEDFKKRNAAVTAENAKVGNINKTLLQARDDEKNGKADVAVKSLQDVIAIKADEPILWASLGEAELALGDTQTRAARAAKTDTKAEFIVKNYADAATSYQKAIDLNAGSKKPAAGDNLAAYYLNLGQALSKSGNIADAGKAYETAAATSPGTAGSAYFNESVVMYTASKLPEAAAAADKAIAADPKKADAYYIKAQALIPGAAPDPKTGKFILPPGCLEAYQAYLELAPEGAHASEVKELLNGLGQPVKNSFKAGKK